MAVGFGTEKLPGRETDPEVVNSASTTTPNISTLRRQSAAVNINPESVYFKYPLAWFAASVAELVTYPLDLTKTRLQVQGELALKSDASNQVKRGMMKTAVGIVTEEGPLKLWQGMSVAIYRHAVYSGVRMGAYEQFRDLLGRDADGRFPLWKAIVASLSAGALGQFLASPADLIKVQIQMEGRRKLEGKPPRVRGSWHAFTKILSEGGVRGLWKGWVPNVQRAALVNMGDLATYDTCKQLILGNTRLKDNYVTHTVASTASGAVAAILGTPADVVKTRVMNQPTDSKGRGLLYKSSVDCVMKTIRSEGFWALYKGFLPIWIRMAPWSLTFWLTHEEIRKLAGASSF